MSRRGHSPPDRYDDRHSGYSRRPPRTERDYEELDIDISRSRYDVPSRRTETVVKERERETDTFTTSGRRSERPGRELDFLREDYGRSSRAGPLVVRDEYREVDDEVYSRGGRTVREERREVDEEVYTRGPSRRARSSAAPAREEKEDIVYRERARSRPRRPPYPQSESEFVEKDEVRFTESTKAASRGAPSRLGPPSDERVEERIDIRIRERDRDRPHSRAPPPRSEFQERDVEEVRVRRRDDRGPPPSRAPEERETIVIREKVEESRAPPPRSEVNKEEITIRETRSSPPPAERRGRDVVKEEEIDINIRERSALAPRPRSRSRGVLVGRKQEEWIVRRPRTPSPSPPPPPREFEKEEIIIRRKTRSPSPEPEPPREPTPEPPKPPPLEPIYRPPIIQEVITHHRYIDHGIERARSPTPPPPSPPSPPKEDNLEIEIKRSGVRNGKRFEEDLVIEQDISDHKGREVERDVETKEISTRRSVSATSRRRSPDRRRYEDDIAAEADYYNRRVSSRAYPGEAYNGATRDWGLVDIPPGTERVRMDGAGGGRQEIYWDRYAGERRAKFATGDRVYEESFGNGLPPPPPPAPEREEVVRETKITEKRIVEETARGKTRDRMWTEITKDLITKEAIEEMGYDYEETDEFYYVMEYLRYENVLKLVELTEDIRRERRERLREIQLERGELERPKMILPPPPAVPPPPRSYYDERFYEREIRYDRDSRRRR